MKPEGFSTGPDISLVPFCLPTSPSAQKGNNSPHQSVGFRFCPCKTGGEHFHRTSGPWCDIPDGLFQCLPDGMSCYDVGLCRFKTEVPGILQRIVSAEEVKFLLRRALLVQRTSHFMGKLHRKLCGEYTLRRFPRSIVP